MICPYCKKQLSEFDVTMEHLIPLYSCKCEETDGIIGTKEVWINISTLKQALDIANAVITNNAKQLLEKEEKDER